MNAYKWTASRPGVNMSSPGDYLTVIVLAENETQAMELAKKELEEYHWFEYRMWDGRKFNVYSEPGVVFSEGSRW